MVVQIASVAAQRGQTPLIAVTAIGFSTFASMAVAATRVTPDLEDLDASGVLAYMVERFHPRLAVACSFQKEASVVLDLLLRIAPDARVFTLDTHVLFPETYETWQRVEERYGISVEVHPGAEPRPPGRRPHGDRLWERDPDACCALRKVDPLNAGARRRRRLDLRRPARAVAAARPHAQARLGRASTSAGRPTRSPTGPRRTSGATSPSTTSRTTRCTTAATPRSAAPTAPSRATGATAAGPAPPRPSAGCTAEVIPINPIELGKFLPMTRELSYLRLLEAEAVFVIREVAAEFERPVLLFSRRQGLDRAAAARREGVPPRRGSPSRSCTSTPATTSPRCSSSATAASRELGERLIVASVQESIDAGPRAGGDRRRRLAQPAADHDAARRDRRPPVRRRARRRPPRRGARPRQGARVLLPRRPRPVGSRRASAPSSGASTTAASAGASTCACSRSANWTELDVWRYIAAEELEVPSIYFAHERSVIERDGMLLADSELRAAARARGAVRGQRPLPHGRRHRGHRRRALRGRDARGGRRARSPPRA